MTQPQRVLRVALATLLVAGGLLDAHEVVLCIAAGSHVGIEFARDFGCLKLLSAEGRTTGSAEDHLNGLANRSSHCEPCIDIPLGIGDPANQRHLTFQKRTSSLKAPLSNVLTSELFTPERVLLQDMSTAQPGSNATFVSLRTTVLLI